MGLIRKLFKRDLTPEQQEEQSRKEKEWMDKCHRKGEEFAERISLNRHVETINDFANAYPRTFFGILFGLLFVFIGINMLMSGSGRNLDAELKHIQELRLPDGQNDARDKVYDEVVKMDSELKKIDGKLNAIMSKDTLTAKDSADIKALLIQADALQKLIDGKGFLPTQDSNNIK